MKRQLLAYRCSCGVWHRENNRGFKRQRCLKCKLDLSYATMPMLPVVCAYIKRVIKRNTLEVSGPKLPRAMGVAEYGEFIRFDRRHVYAADLKTIAERFSFTVRHVSKFIELDIQGLQFLVNTANFPRCKHISMAWKSLGRKRAAA